MKITKLYYPTPLERISDKSNDNLDVIITFDDNSSLCIVVATPENLKRQIENSGEDFLPFGLPQIIVSRLEKGIIERAVTSYAAESDMFKKYFID